MIKRELLKDKYYFLYRYYLKKSLDNVYEEYLFNNNGNSEEHVNRIISSYEIMIKLVDTRFKSELKHQNNNKNKAYDEFTGKKILNEIGLYISDFMMIMVKEDEKEYYQRVRSELFKILNNLYYEHNRVFIE